MIIQLYTDKKGEIRWRLISKGRTIATSGEGYKRKASCIRALNSVKAHISTAKFYDVTELTPQAYAPHRIKQRKKR